MLLLFKMMTIICNSNHQKVNYIRQSGISKDLSNNIISVLNCHSQAFKDIEAKQADIEKKLNSLQFNN